MFYVESLIDESWHLCGSWDEAWWWAKHICCHGGDPVGNVLVHEVNAYDPSTFVSEHSPGCKQSRGTRIKIGGLLFDLRANAAMA